MTFSFLLALALMGAAPAEDLGEWRVLPTVSYHDRGDRRKADESGWLVLAAFEPRSKNEKTTTPKNVLGQASKVVETVTFPRAAAKITPPRVGSTFSYPNLTRVVRVGVPASAPLVVRPTFSATGVNRFAAPSNCASCRRR